MPTGLKIRQDDYEDRAPRPYTEGGNAGVGEMRKQRKFTDGTEDLRPQDFYSVHHPMHHN